MAATLGEKIYIGNRRVTGSDVQKLVSGAGIAFLDPAALERVGFPAVISCQIEVAGTFAGR